MRDQQSSDTSIALDANTDVQQEADKPAVKWRYLFGFLAWTVLNAIAFYMTASIMIPQRLKDIGVANPDATLGAINAAGAILSIFYAVFIGAFSDRTRSRFGRRTPWILGGAVLYGVAIWVISLPTSGLTPTASASSA